MKEINIILLLFAVSILCDVETISGQDSLILSEYNLQVRLIKVKRMSKNWSNSRMELHGDTGLISSGDFLGIHKEYIRLESSGKQIDIPVKNIQSIVIKRKPTDLILVGLISVGAGALFTGIASLGFESEGASLIGFAAVGSTIGFTFGWKSFYIDTLIPI